MINTIQRNVLSLILVLLIIILGFAYTSYKYSIKSNANSIGYKYQNAKYDQSTPQSAIYKVQNGILIKNQNSIEQKVWDIFTKNVPQLYVDQIEAYEVSYLEEDMTLANIEKINLESNQNVFKLKINIEKLKTLSTANEIEETRVLPIFIHELGHQISLQTDQLEPNTYTNQKLDKNEYVKDFNLKQSQCHDTYYLKEGCSKPNSYINQFYQKFWTQSWSEYQNIQEIKNDNEFNQKSLEFYEKYKEEFVSKEAFFSPEEDFAESFRVFVLGDKSKLSGIAKQKVEFFEGVGEMINIASEIRL